MAKQQQKAQQDADCAHLRAEGEAQPCQGARACEVGFSNLTFDDTDDTFTFEVRSDRWLVEKVDELRLSRGCKDIVADGRGGDVAYSFYCTLDLVAARADLFAVCENGHDDDGETYDVDGVDKGELYEAALLALSEEKLSFLGAASFVVGRDLISCPGTRLDAVRRQSPAGRLWHIRMNAGHPQGKAYTVALRPSIAGVFDLCEELLAQGIGAL